MPFIIVPIFGFANAGVSFGGVGFAGLIEPLTLGIAGGLVFGKLVGVFGSAGIAIRLGFADLPVHASWMQLFGTALLCGIGFTMSLFIGLLAFADPSKASEVRLGVLGGSILSAVLGFVILRYVAKPAVAASAFAPSPTRH